MTADAVDDRTAAVEAFASFPARLAAAATSAADRPVPAGEWGPREVVRHLIAVEREVWWGRFGSMLEAGEPHWSWMEPGLEPGLDDATLDDVLTRYRETRAATVAILDRYGEVEWHRTGVHATFGRLDALGLLRIVTDHDLEHLASLG